MTPDRQFYDLHKMGNHVHKRGTGDPCEGYDIHGNQKHSVGDKRDKHKAGEKHEPPGSGKREKRRDYIEENVETYSGGDHRPTSGHRTPSAGRRTPYSDAYEIMDNNEISPRKIRDDIPDSDLIDYEDDGEGESLLDDVELEYDESRVRIFIALFNYDPMTMSPNPDAGDEELPFKEGQLLKVRTDIISLGSVSKDILTTRWIPL